MCRVATVDLPPTPQSPGDARRWLADTVSRWELPDLRDVLLLAVSELVTNSVLHARTPLVVNVTVSSGIVEVGVRDHSRQRPVPRAPRSDLIGDLDELSERLPSFEDEDPRHPSTRVNDGSVLAGRGLHVLSAVSDAWGVVSHEGDPPGKEVWFTHSVPESWPYTDRCPCRHASQSLVTASGRPVLAVPGAWDE